MHKKILFFVAPAFLAFVVLSPSLAVAAGNLRIGAPCNIDEDCRSNDCENSDLGQAYCDCDTVSAAPGPITPDSEDCGVEYGRQQDEKWTCHDGTNASHDLDFCESNQRGFRYPLPKAETTITDVFTDPEASASLTEDELKKLLQKPQPRITIPGLRFSDITVKGSKPNESGDDVTLSVPFIGEYIAAVYRYAIAIAAIVAVVFIIIGGIQWALSGGSAEAITGARKKIGQALIGLTIIVLSYSLLYFVNPNLVAFKNLLITYIPSQYDLDKVVYSDKTIFKGTPKPITDTTFDTMFKAFANCIHVDWRTLKVFAYKESGLNPTIVNKQSGYGGLFQTKPANCRGALKKFPEWSAQCNQVVTNPYVNTAVGTQMLNFALTQIKKKCQEPYDMISVGMLVYLNHNSGGGALEYLLKHNLCAGPSDAIKAGINDFWHAYRGGREWSDEKATRGPYAEGVAQLIARQGVTDFFDTSQNGDATCPLNGLPPDKVEASYSGVDPKFANPDIQCSAQFAGHQVLALGDSITVGVGSGNTSYEERLAGNCPQVQFQKIAEGGKETSWMYSQIKDRDLGNEGFDELIILGGVNNATNGKSAESIEQSLSLIYNQAKQQGLRVIAITITPWKGSGPWTAAKQAVTDEVNGWIRSQAGGLVDVVVDGYQVLGSQADPMRLNPAYDADHIHPNAAGQTALAVEISRRAFR